MKTYPKTDAKIVRSGNAFKTAFVTADPQTVLENVLLVLEAQKKPKKPAAKQEKDDQKEFKEIRGLKAVTFPESEIPIAIVTGPAEAIAAAIEFPNVKHAHFIAEAVKNNIISLSVLKKMLQDVEVKAG